MTEVPSQVPLHDQEIKEQEICFLRTETYISTLEEPIRVLLEGFFASPQAANIANIVAKFSPQDAADKKYFLPALAGEIFEETVHPFVEQHYPNLVVLSGLETRLLFQGLHPDREVRSFYGLNVGIAGISYPDFMVLNIGLDITLVEAFVECKLPRSINSKNLNQLNKYLSMVQQAMMYQPGGDQNMEDISAGVFLHQLRPELPDQPITLSPKIDIVYVVPENSTLDHPKIRRLPVPLTSFQFGEFIQCFSADCRNTKT